MSEMSDYVDGLQKQINQALAIPRSLLFTKEVQCPTCGDEPEMDGGPCEACGTAKYSPKGLTYVVEAEDGHAYVLETECGCLSFDIGELSARCDELGMDEPGAPGIWKAVVTFWCHRDYWGETDTGYNVEEWEEVESYPEPNCDLFDMDGGHGRCEGMLKHRDEAETTWACDAHAGRVS